MLQRFRFPYAVERIAAGVFDKRIDAFYSCFVALPFAVFVPGTIVRFSPWSICLNEFVFFQLGSSSLNIVQPAF